MIPSFRLDGKIALVTGADKGIGRAIATAYAAAGADIFIASLTLDNQKEIETQIRSFGREVSFFQADLSQENSIKDTIETCVKKMGTIDILVNNAGMISRAPLLEGKLEDWRKVIDINLNAVYYMSRLASVYMNKQHAGKIINIASLLSFQGGKFVPSYTASKHGVAGLTKAFANELAAVNIQTNAIAPGYIATDNTAPIRADENRNAEILGRIPAARWGDVSDLLGAAVFLASEAADYVNGHILVVDGGWLAR